MNWKRVIVLSQAFLFGSLWFSGLVQAQTPVTSQTPPATTPADQMTKGKKRMKSTMDSMTAAPTTATPATSEPASAPQTMRGTRHRTGSAQRAMEDTEKAKSMPARTASETDIRAARASGKVWVNTDSGVYHKGGKWYGATKQGKFMTEQEAMQAGYKPARNEK